MMLMLMPEWRQESKSITYFCGGLNILWSFLRQKLCCENENIESVLSIVFDQLFSQVEIDFSPLNLYWLSISLLSLVVYISISIRITS